ncbi:MAG: hypothetical protein WC455_26380 [Dehalococcoidia bacterium]
MKKRTMVDVKITCDPPRCWRHCPTMEELAKFYEEWVRDFHSFIRDHRSQDPVTLDVEREYKDLCSFCGFEWDVDENGCPLCCDEAIAECEKEQKKSSVMPEKKEDGKDAA